MDIRLFKENVLNNSVKPQMYALVYDDNNSIILQYVNHIAQSTNNPITYLNELDDLQDLMSLGDYDDGGIYVLQLDKLTDKIPRSFYKLFCFIICKEVTNNDDLETIKFPKVETWQMLDYARVSLKGVNERKIEWLVNLLGNNQLRLENEINKITIFPMNERDAIFDLINNDGGYDDITNLTMFNLVTAISKKSKQEIIDVLEAIKLIDIEPMGLVTSLLKQFKLAIDVKMGTKDYKVLNISQKQYIAIKKYNPYTSTELVKAYKLLTNVDYELKIGLLPNEYIVDYVICNIL
jgi:hypothetical protein